MIKPILSNNLTFKAVYLSDNLNEKQRVNAVNIFNQLQNSPKDHQNRNYIEQLDKDYQTNIHFEKGNGKEDESVSVILRQKRGEDIELGSFDNKKNKFDISNLESRYAFGENIDEQPKYSSIGAVILSILAAIGIIMGIVQCSKDKIVKSAKGVEKTLVSQPSADTFQKTVDTLRIH